VTPPGDEAGDRSRHATDPEAIAEILARALGEPAAMVAVWTDAPSVPAPRRRPRITAIYALPSRRFATLRHWRDEVETRTGDGVDVVAFEASKWARLLLKSHGGTLLTSLEIPESGTPEGQALGPLAASLWDDVADAWIAAAGIPRPTLDRPSGTSLGGPARFARAEAWLDAVRRRADREDVTAAPETTDPDGNSPGRQRP
jgi:hypothetical protein